MKKIKGQFLILILSMCFAAHGQDRITGDFFEVTRFMESQKSQNSILKEGERQANHQQVFIEQVGNGNSVTSKINAENSVVKYSQHGNQHTANVHIHSKTYQGNITQKGNNNNVFDNAYAPTEEVSLNLSQNGRNLHFERHGSNSIGDKLNFKMNGSNKSIIVRNFK